MKVNHNKIFFLFKFSNKSWIMNLLMEMENVIDSAGENSEVCDWNVSVKL